MKILLYHDNTGSNWIIGEAVSSKENLTAEELIKKLDLDINQIAIENEWNDLTIDKLSVEEITDDEYEYYFPEEGTDAQFGKYDDEVFNGNGYYDEDGIFHRYRDPIA